MAAIPGYQTPTNEYQIAGAALQQGAGVFDKMAALIEKRKQNLIQQRNDQIEAEYKATTRAREDEKYKREQEALKREDAFRKTIGEGKRLPGPATEEGVYPSAQYEPPEIMEEALRQNVIDPLEYAKLYANDKTGMTVTSDALGNIVRIPHKTGSSPEYVKFGEENVKKGYAPKAPIRGGDEFYYQTDPVTGLLVKTNVQTPDAVKNKIAHARLAINQADLRIKQAQLDRGFTEDKAKEEFKIENTTSSLDRLANSAKTIKDSPDLWRITGWVGSLWDMPGSDAADLRAELETLESQIAFGVLQNMRDASKTGGALGNVSEREIEFLKNNLAALKTSQSPEAFAENLQKIIDFTNGSKSRMSSAYKKGWAKAQSPGVIPNDSGNSGRRKGTASDF